MRCAPRRLGHTNTGQPRDHLVGYPVGLAFNGVVGPTDLQASLKKVWSVGETRHDERGNRHDSRENGCRAFDPLDFRGPPLDRVDQCSVPGRSAHDDSVSRRNIGSRTLTVSPPIAVHKTPRI